MLRTLLVAAAAAVVAPSTATPPSAQVAAPATYSPQAELTAPIAYMVDLGSGRVLFERDANRRFLPASLTKIMTAYVAFEMIGQGRLHPNQRVIMSDAAFEQWHRVGSTMFIARGQAVTVDELLQGIMTVSANDGCVVLAEGARGSVANFVARMNAEARALGMRDTHFGSPNGWPDEGRTYTTARDLATLSQALLTRHPALYRRYVGQREMTFNGITQPNHVPVVGTVAGADGIKTGFTNESGYGFVGSALRNGRRLVMVVGGYDRPAARARESRDFLEWGFGAWRTRPLFGAGEPVGSARVQGGAERSVPLIAPAATYLTTRAGEKAGPIGLRISYHGPIRAPVRKGRQIATLEMTQPGQTPHAVPLFAGAEVPVAGRLARLRNGVLGAFGL